MTTRTEYVLICALLPLLKVFEFFLYLHDFVCGWGDRRRVKGFFKKYGSREMKGRTIERMKIKTQRTEYASVVSRAFLNETMNVYCCDSIEIRRQVYYESHYDFINDRNALCFVVYDSDNDSMSKGVIRGCAMWAAPKSDLTILSICKFAKTFLYRVGCLWKFIEMMKAGSAEQVMGDQKERGFFRLLCIGVDPTSHRKGYGSDLLRYMTDIADETGYCCCLETMDEDNVTFYNKHGFEVKREIQLGGKVSHYLMRRDPNIMKKED